ncbi:MAG: aldose 1-epimerase family protein [Actinomycetota bacterium]
MPTTHTPSGAQHEIAYGDQRVTVTEVGATVRRYAVGGRAVIDGFDVHEMSTAGRGQVLAPWPNRLEEGTYSFEGIEGHAPLDEPERGNAIHGLVRWLPWTVAGRTDASLTMACVLHPSPAYPWRVELQITYALGEQGDEQGLTVTTRATNRWGSRAPFGLGFHPYLTAGTVVIDEGHLRVPARRRLVSDERGLPVGEETVEDTAFDFSEPQHIASMVLDTAFTDLVRDDDGRVRVSLTDAESGRNVTLWADRAFTHLMVYTGDTLTPVWRRRQGIAIEPMTCPPNSFRSGNDVIRLDPGAPWTGAWGIQSAP